MSPERITLQYSIFCKWEHFKIESLFWRTRFSSFWFIFDVKTTIFRQVARIQTLIKKTHGMLWTEIFNMLISIRLRFEWYQIQRSANLFPWLSLHGHTTCNDWKKMDKDQCDVYFTSKVDLITLTLRACSASGVNFQTQLLMRLLICIKFPIDPCLYDCILRISIFHL